MRHAALLRLTAIILAAAALAACGTTSGVRQSGGPGFARPTMQVPGEPTQCVPFARERSGIEIYGDAKTWWEQAAGQFRRSPRPQAGAVLVLKGYGGRDSGHVALVRRVIDSRTIVIDHANWLNDGNLYFDQPVRDVSAGNDWSAVNVWYHPGHSWGARAYTVEGFILPQQARPAVYAEAGSPAPARRAGQGRRIAAR